MHKTKNTAMLGSRVNWLARLWAAVVSWLTLAEPEGKIRVGDSVYRRPDGRFQTEQPNG